METKDMYLFGEITQATVDSMMCQFFGGTLYLNSSEASLDSIPVFVEYLDKLADVDIALPYCVENGVFEIVFKTQHSVRLLSSFAYGSLTLTSYSSNSSELLDEHSHDSLLQKYIQKRNNEQLRFARYIGCNDDEYERLRRGKTVYFDKKRMLELFEFCNSK